MVFFLLLIFQTLAFQGMISTCREILMNVMFSSHTQAELEVMRTTNSSTSQKIFELMDELMQLKTQCSPSPSNDGPSSANSRTLTFKMDRAFNVVVYGIPEEGTSDSRQFRQLNDLSKVIDLIHFIDDTIPLQSIRECYRLGRYKNDSHPRPLLVRLSRKSEVKSILSNRSKLNPPFWIKPDMTPEEMVADSLLMKERWSLIQTGVEQKDIKVSKDSLYVKGQIHAVVEESQLVLQTP